MTSMSHPMAVTVLVAALVLTAVMQRCRLASRSAGDRRRCPMPGCRCVRHRPGRPPGLRRPDVPSPVEPR